MSAFYKCLVFAPGKDRKNTSIKLVNPKFAGKSVWLKLKTNENKPDFDAQRVIAEILWNMVGSNSHYELTIHRKEIINDEKGNLSVAISLENLKSRWNIVLKASPSKDKSAARKLFTKVFDCVQSKLGWLVTPVIIKASLYHRRYFS